jgi:hypothetical protein
MHTPVVSRVEDSLTWSVILLYHGSLAALTRMSAPECLQFPTNILVVQLYAYKYRYVMVSPQGRYSSVHV